MLATFVIGLREGLEAALIVGIIASFLHQQGRAAALRQVWFGILAALAVCAAVAGALWAVSSELTRQAQEGMETVIGVLAVVMVTSMVWWMRRHARSLRHDLEGAASSALARGSALALVAMAFLAVLREGVESAVFLLALLRSSQTPAYAAGGAALGFAVAAGLGYAIYAGGVRLNLARFFRATGVVLVVVAAGLVMSVLHTAHEAGWLDAGQATVADLTWLVAPGSVQASVLTGVLGLQAQPTVVETAGWLAYLVPLLLLVLWPARRRPAPAAAPAPDAVPATPGPPA